MFIDNTAFACYGKGMNKNVLIGLLVIIVLVFAGYALYAYRQTKQVSLSPSPTPQAVATATPTPQTTKTITVPLAEVNKSGESGTAMLAETNGKVDVTISLTGFTNDISQPAHIHIGVCPGIGSIKYPLTAVVNGASKTTLSIDMKTLLSQLPLAINVHKSQAAIGVYTACGDITTGSVSVTPSAAVVSPTATPTTSPTSSPTPTPTSAPTRGTGY